MPPIHPDLTAARAVDACGGTYTPEEEATGWAGGYSEALCAAARAVAKPDALMAEMLEALKGLVGDHTVGGTWRTEGAVIDNARAVIAKAEAAPSTVGGR